MRTGIGPVVALVKVQVSLQGIHLRECNDLILLCYPQDFNEYVSPCICQINKCQVAKIQSHFVPMFSLTSPILRLKYMTEISKV